MENTKNLENIKNFLLVDTSSLIYRFGYALQDMSNNKNKPIGAIWGTLRILTEVNRKYNIFSTIFALDSAVNNRKIEYTQYKQHRKPSPDFIKQQMPIFYNIIHHMKSHSFICSGFEADDTIASLATRINQQSNCHTFVLTTDKDMLQLVKNNCSVLLLGSGGVKCISTNQHVQDIVGVYAEQYADFLALAGDATDNIPGVRGIGPKAAISLLKMFTSLENILNNISAIPNANIRKKMEDGKEFALISKSLSLMRIYDITIDDSIWNYCNNHTIWSQNAILLTYLKEELNIDLFLL